MIEKAPAKHFANSRAAFFRLFSKVCAMFRANEERGVNSLMHHEFRFVKKSLKYTPPKLLKGATTPAIAFEDSVFRQERESGMLKR